MGDVMSKRRRPLPLRELQAQATAQREALRSGSSCPNCGDPGRPGHHWLADPGVYICHGRDDGTVPA